MCEPDVGRVECYSGSTYAQEPRAVIWQGKRQAIARVERSWRTPEGPGFQVQTEAGEQLELQYDERQDRWTIRECPSRTRRSKSP